jgi:hypothetical protein
MKARGNAGFFSATPRARPTRNLEPGTRNGEPASALDQLHFPAARVPSTPSSEPACFITATMTVSPSRCSDMIRNSPDGGPPNSWIDLVHFLVQNRPMIKLNIHQAKTHLSHYLARLKEGETLVICKRNTPIAEVRPLPATPRKPRPLGLATS